MPARAVGGIRSPMEQMKDRAAAMTIWSPVSSRASRKGTPSTEAAP